MKVACEICGLLTCETIIFDTIIYKPNIIVEACFNCYTRSHMRPKPSITTKELKNLRFQSYRIVYE